VPPVGLDGSVSPEPLPSPPSEPQPCSPEWLGRLIEAMHVLTLSLNRQSQAIEALAASNESLVDALMAGDEGEQGEHLGARSLSS
jgi:hypothetical protein